MLRKLYRLLICCFVLIAICSISYGQEIKEFKRIESNVIEWSPTGEYIATGHTGGVAIWDSLNGALVKQFYTRTMDSPVFPPSVLDLAWNPTGTQLAIELNYPDAPNFVQIIDITNDEIIYDSIPIGVTLRVDWSPNGDQLVFGYKEISGHYESTEIRLFDLTLGEISQVIPIPDYASVGEFKFNHQGNMLAYNIINSDGYEIVVRDIENSTLHVTLPHTTQIREFDWRFDDQQIFSASDGDGLQIWDANTGELVHSFDYSLRSLDAHPSENILAVIHNSNPAIINTNSGNLIYESTQTTSNSGISWNADGSIFSVFRVVPMRFTREGEALALFPALISINIVEAEVDVYVAGLESGDTINRSDFENPDSLAFQAYYSVIDTIQSVVFNLNNQITIDNEFPFEIPMPSAGNYELTATPFTELDGGGIEGISLTLSFSVTD